MPIVPVRDPVTNRVTRVGDAWLTRWPADFVQITETDYATAILGQAVVVIAAVAALAPVRDAITNRVARVSLAWLTRWPGDWVQISEADYAAAIAGNGTTGAGTPAAGSSISYDFDGVAYFNGTNGALIADTDSVPYVATTDSTLAADTDGVYYLAA